MSVTSGIAKGTLNNGLTARVEWERKSMDILNGKVSFDMTLYITLHRLIGLKSVIFVEFFILGTKVILVLLISVIDILEFKTFKIMHMTSLPIIIQ